MMHHSALFKGHASRLNHAFFEKNELAFDDQVTHLVGTPTPLFTLKQTHSPHVVTLHTRAPFDTLPEADALVTKIKGIALGIRTADCGPILFFDPEQEVIGACHAGWRGAHAGVMEKTLEAMEALGARRSSIIAAIGPLIHQEDYEVGPEFPDIILEKEGGPYGAYFQRAPKPGHHYFSMPAYIRGRLKRAGIQKIDDVGLNTFRGNFFSRRKIIHEGNPYEGASNLSVIALRD